MAEEGVAAHLAVGDDVEPGGLLQRDRLVDGAILDALECRGGELALLEASPGVEKYCRAKQAANRLAAGSHVRTFYRLGHAAGCQRLLSQVSGRG